LKTPGGRRPAPNLGESVVSPQEKFLSSEPRAMHHKQPARSTPSSASVRGHQIDPSARKKKPHDLRSRPAGFVKRGPRQIENRFGVNADLASGGGLRRGRRGRCAAALWRTEIRSQSLRMGPPVYRSERADQCANAERPSRQRPPKPLRDWGPRGCRVFSQRRPRRQAGCTIAGCRRNIKNVFRAVDPQCHTVHHLGWGAPLRIQRRLRWRFAASPARIRELLHLHWPLVQRAFRQTARYPASPPRTRKQLVHPQFCSCALLLTPLPLLFDMAGFAALDVIYGISFIGQGDLRVLCSVSGLPSNNFYVSKLP